MDLRHKRRITIAQNLYALSFHTKKDSKKFLNDLDEKTKKIIKQKILFDKIQAPVEKGQRIGCILIKMDKKTIAEASVVAKESIDRISRFKWLIRKYVF